MRYPKGCKVWEAAAKDPRYSALAEVRVDGGRLLATDGRILAVVPFEADEVTPETEGWLTADAMKAAARGRKGEPAEIRLNGVQQVPSVGQSFAFPYDADDAPAFPAAGEILDDAIRQEPDEGYPRRIILNPSYLLRLAKALGCPDGIALEQRAEWAPLIARPARCGEPASADAIGLIMPISEA